MMRLKRLHNILFATFTFWLIYPFSLFAQAEMKNKELKETAEKNYYLENYHLAQPYYEELVKRYPKKIDYQYDLGICYLAGSSKDRDQALSLFKSIESKNQGFREIYYQLGKAHMVLHHFDSAIANFERAKSINQDPIKTEQITRLIENCKNGKELLDKAIDVQITNLGPNINSPYKEYAPVISTDESVLIFTYRGEKSIGGLQNMLLEPDPKNGEYYEDIYQSYKIGNEWSVAQPLGEEINSKGHDASIALSADGQTLFTYRNDLEKDIGNGEIYVSFLKGSTWSTPKLLNENINSPYWEGSVSMSADGNILYFASNRPGGYGGRDLYVSYKTTDNMWKPAENMGPTINTKYDDDAPFIHPNNKILYFSSKGHNSMGEYDIFTSIKEDGKWRTPINLGYPVNTTADDIYYVVSADGKHGYLSSDREGGYGLDDIYTVSPGLLQADEPISLVLLKGIVTANDTVRGGLVSVFDYADTSLISQHTVNEETGKFLLTLPSGKEYLININIDGFPIYSNMISTINVDSFKKIHKDVQIFTPAYAKNKEVKARINLATKTINIESMDEGTEGLVYDEIIQQYGKNKSEGLEFTIQVGAYKNASQFEYQNLLAIGQIHKNKFKDGITRFELGRYTTMEETEAIRQKVKQQGYWDAFILGLYKGGRYTTTECVKKGLIIN